MILFKTQAESLMANDLSFFVKAGTHNDVQVAQSLLDKGVIFTFEFFNVRAHYQGQLLASADLPVTMVKILEDKITAEQKLALAKVTKKLINDTLHATAKMGLAVLTIPKKKTSSPSEGVKIVLDTKSYEAALKSGSAGIAKAVKTAAKATAEVTKSFADLANGMSKDKPMALAKAMELGQAVYGSEANSIYRVAGYRTAGPRLAVRFHPGNAHFRVEGPLDLSDKKRLADVGFKMKSGTGHSPSYWSLHMSIGSIPRVRVLGAVLFDLNEVFPMHVNSLAEVSYD